MAAPSSPLPASVVLWQGRAFLAWAQFLQWAVLARSARDAHIARRNAAMRAARDCGISEEAIIKATGLTPQWVRRALEGDSTSE